jgi:Uncharacterized conserved protein
MPHNLIRTHLLWKAQSIRWPSLRSSSRSSRWRKVSGSTSPEKTPAFMIDTTTMKSGTQPTGHGPPFCRSNRSVGPPPGFSCAECASTSLPRLSGSMALALAHIPCGGAVTTGRACKEWPTSPTSMLAVTMVRSGTSHTKCGSMTATPLPPPWASTEQTRSGFTMSMAMCGSGAWTAGARTSRRTLKAQIRMWSPRNRLTAFLVVAALVSAQGWLAVRVGSYYPRPTWPTIWAFVRHARSNL